MIRRLRKVGVEGLPALFVALIIGAVSVASTTAHATSFEVRGIAVDVTAETAAAARDKALADGEVQAYEVLLDRLVEPQARASAPKASAEDIRDMVADFSINGEKTSAVRYIATLDYRFDPEAVQRFLLRSGVPFVAAPSKPVVVVPVFAEADALVLWDYPNPWRDAWEAGATSDGLVPIIVPEGDLKDVSVIGAEAADRGDLARLRALADRYDAGDAVVAVARVVTDGRSGTSLVTVTTTRYGDTGPLWTAEQNIKSEPGENAAPPLARAVAAVEEELEARWKRTSTVKTGGGSVVDVTVPISGIRDWVDVRRRLENSVVVREAEVVMLSRNEVRLKLHYVGDLDQLAAALEKEQLGLVRKSGEWVLEPPSRDGGGT